MDLEIRRRTGGNSLEAQRGHNTIASFRVLEVGGRERDRSGNLVHRDSGVQSTFFFVSLAKECIFLGQSQHVVTSRHELKLSLVVIERKFVCAESGSVEFRATRNSPGYVDVNHIPDFDRGDSSREYSAVVIQPRGAIDFVRNPGAIQRIRRRRQVFIVIAGPVVGPVATIVTLNAGVIEQTVIPNRVT